MKSLLINIGNLAKTKLVIVLLFITYTTFTSCKKDTVDLDHVGIQSTAEDIAYSNRIVESSERMNSKDLGSLELRTTYTLAELMDLTMDGLSYEYSTLFSTVGTTYSYRDTISIGFASSTSITDLEALAIYDSIASKASQQARSIGISPVYFYAIALSTYSVTSTSANVVIRGIYSDGDPQGPVNPPTSIPEGRDFNLNFKCTGGAANSASVVLTDWVNSLQPAVGIGTNQFITTRTFTTVNTAVGDPFYASALDAGCQTANSSDPTSGDGSVDTRSFYFLCSDATCSAMTSDLDCISPTEYAYHAPQVAALFNEERIRRGATYVKRLLVKGFDSKIGSPEKELKRWHLSGLAVKVLSTVPPHEPPGKDILE